MTRQCNRILAVLFACRVFGILPHFGELQDFWHDPHCAILLEHIRPAVVGVNPKLPMDEKIDAAVEANVRWSIEQLKESPRHKKAIDEGLIFLIGAVYEMESGRVRLIE